MFNNSFVYHVRNECSDKEGNFFVLEINVHVYKTNDILLVNIYGPNMMIQTFFNQYRTSKFEGEFIIIAGDFKLVHDVDLDYFNYINVNNKRAREKVLNMKVVHGLTDP